MDAGTQDPIRDLDPFGFMEGQASVIRPLGGKERSLDPRYAFHTPYVEFRPGRVMFTIRFDRLRATFGELRVNINAFIPGSGRDAIFVTSARIPLSDSMAAERGLAISFMSVAGATYAAYGYCTEGTDAQAAGLSVRAEQIESSDDPALQQPLLPTRLSTPPLVSAVRLVNDAAPSFQDPVSQAMSAGQLAEPDAHKWLSRLSPRPSDPEAQWRLAFLAQALDRYGALQPGARGIGWGEESRALAPVFAAAQAEVALVDPPAGDGSALSWNAIACSTLDARPGPDGLRPGMILSLTDQPADERGFDFLWTIGQAEQGHAAGSCANHLVELMAMLRPGGPAVHLFDVTADMSDGPALPRREIDRLAVMLLARGFSVAQLNFAGLAERGGPVPFGLIVRKD
ncbi:hypothetical protein [Rhizorhabdus dicambivorans]|uniref:Uncharacterized protein n=1 Tax=Rhizorhabdus dicambivorans TaxID=1850238 RepID=A0A2A4FZM6_9SPHN|nr:hypothetical protein [Rhizorhabdus dicambivorans]ATE66605.1 hypothetical protein CMV14_21115 [Rhizorhabdus dicambivorans]PCE43912.1 hypothetical protein COO09_03035 [Rhizorhabdus dicambivorans]